MIAGVVRTIVRTTWFASRTGGDSYFDGYRITTKQSKECTEWSLNSSSWNACLKKQRVPSGILLCLCERPVLCFGLGQK